MQHETQYPQMWCKDGLPHVHVAAVDRLTLSLAYQLLNSKWIGCSGTVCKSAWQCLAENHFVCLSSQPGRFQHYSGTQHSYSVHSCLHVVVSSKGNCLPLSAAPSSHAAAPGGGAGCCWPCCRARCKVSTSLLVSCPKAVTTAWEGVVDPDRTWAV